MAPPSRWLPVTIVAFAFAALGLPDGALGVAWPSVRRDFALPVSALGSLLLVMMAGHLVASLVSGPAAVRVGSGRLLLWSNVAYAASALGFVLAPGWWTLMAAGLLAGVGAGLIDAGLNAYAAVRVSPGVLTLLHACFGAGATAGPMILGGMLTAGRTWREGYLVFAGALGAMTLALALTRRVLDGGVPSLTGTAPGGPRLRETLGRPGLWLGAALFLLYAGLEAAPGRWAYSLLVESRGVPPQRAALASAAYWGSITIGRLAWGVAARRLAPRAVLRGCLTCAPLGALLVWTGSDGPLTVGGLVILGLCFAPVFPLLIALTPDRVGAGHAGHVIGLQVSAATLGTGLLPAAIGFMARRRGLEVVGPLLLGAALLTLLLYQVAEARARLRPPPSP